MKRGSKVSIITFINYESCEYAVVGGAGECCLELITTDAGQIAVDKPEKQYLKMWLLLRICLAMCHSWT